MKTKEPAAGVNVFLQDPHSTKQEGSISKLCLGQKSEHLGPQHKDCNYSGAMSQSGYFGHQEQAMVRCGTMLPLVLQLNQKYLFSPIEQLIIVNVPCWGHV